MGPAPEIWALGPWALYMGVFRPYYCLVWPYYCLVMQVASFSVVLEGPAPDLSLGQRGLFLSWLADIRGLQLICGSYTAV